MNEFLDNMALLLVEGAIISFFVAVIYVAWHIIPKKYREKIIAWVNEMYSRVNE